MATVATERPTLPVPVLDEPHWRVNFRPDEYDPELIPTLAECFRLVEQTSVRFRGWPYPYLSNRQDERSRLANSVESWVNNEYATEYWRFYQSGQFLHLFNFEENKSHYRGQQHAARRLLDGSVVRGFIYFPNFLYTITEIFEFATRLCLKKLHRGSLEITIELKNIERFRLWSPNPARHVPYEWVCHKSDLGRSWSFPGTELIAKSADHALDATIWFYERFGVEEPDADLLKGALRRDQQELFSRHRGG